MAGQQQEEIETIRSRTIEVKLSDADVKRISEKAAAHGLTVGELIENFIGDLVCGTYSNGSDERMYAEQWFERCWFGMFPDLTFLRYLIEWGGLDEVIGAWENIKSTEENIQTSEEALASGVMKGRGGRTYTWKDLLGMMCNQFLKSFERRGEGNKTPILFLIDEFPRLGKIEAISNGLATLRSKKIHIALIVQSKSQLNAIYGKDVAEVIADNCPYKAILKASEPETQEWCSKLVGTYDKKKVSSNYNADILGVGKGQGTSSSTEEKRIIKPEEFAYLKDVVCVFPNGYKRLQKANYYEDKTFTDRM